MLRVRTAAVDDAVIAEARQLIRRHTVKHLIDHCPGVASIASLEVPALATRTSQDRESNARRESRSGLFDIDVVEPGTHRTSDSPNDGPRTVQANTLRRTERRVWRLAWSGCDDEPMEHDADRAAPEWDVFISHASEDKDAVVRPLAEELRGRGVRVWYDEYSSGSAIRSARALRWASPGPGAASSLSARTSSIGTGPGRKLNGLTALEGATGAHRVLPVWHNVDHAEVASQAPMLADRVAATTDLSIPELAVKLIEALGADGSLEDRLPVVALSVEVTKVTTSVVSVMLRNVGSTHAMHVSLEPRGVEGRGVPLTVGYSEAILAGASHVIELERFPPQDAQADALYDLLYADPGELVLKHQRLHFFLAR